ncbi:MAG: ATP-binding protein [Planctomycetota bacterium]|nr:ATP-binding protein [Planctomycetota bacterium]
MPQWLNVIFFLSSFLIICSSLYYGLKLYTKIKHTKNSWQWLVLLGLIGLISIGYLIALALAINDTVDWIAQLTPILFLIAAIYVLLTIMLSQKLSKTFLRSSRTLESAVEKRTEELQAMMGELEESKQTLVAAGKVQSQFLANVSHEIRTPMTAILGYLNILIDTPPSPNSTQKYLLSIQHNAKQLLSIMNDILDLSKIEAGEMKLIEEACFPPSIVENVILLLKPLADKKGLQLKVQLKNTAPPLIQTDSVRLQQILTNLVNNAIKFSDEGAIQLIIDWEATNDDSGELKISVKDSGIGIANEDLERIFSPFAQAKSRQDRPLTEGTGLGLAISMKLARMLGGTITVESEIQKGSQFTLAYTAKINTTKNAKNPSGDTSRRLATKPLSIAGVRVLVAEDGADNREIINVLLEHAGAQVVAVTNGQEALDILQINRGLNQDFHCLLLDMQMPVLDGYETIKALRARGDDIPVIALTAYAMPTDRKKCIEAGCDEYLSKPFSTLSLINSIHRFTESHVQVLRQKRMSSSFDAKIARITLNYIAKVSKTLKELEQHYHDQDTVALSSKLHKLTGSAGLYGFPGISELARQLEVKFREGALNEETRSELNDFIEQFQKLLGEKNLQLNG